MNELIKHIELLLLENDCVVIPNFGGFITHYNPAKWDREEGLFYPPSRTIGFNPALKMNDGMLVQSYMQSYKTDYSDASRILQTAIDKITTTLHNEGAVSISGLGTITLSIDNTYLFSAFQEGINSPAFYGLDAFDIEKLDTLLLKEANSEKKSTSVTGRKSYVLHINKAFIRNVAAIAVGIVCFFMLSTPLENTHVDMENYAQLLPTGMHSLIGASSLLITPINVTTPTQPTQESSSDDAEPETIQDIIVVEPTTDIREAVAVEAPLHQPEIKEAPEAKRPAKSVAKPEKLYHVIVASVTKLADAEEILTQLHSEGFTDARILKETNRIRICTASYATRNEAEQQLSLIRQGARKDAWLLIR